MKVIVSWLSSIETLLFSEPCALGVSDTAASMWSRCSALFQRGVDLIQMLAAMQCAHDPALVMCLDLGQQRGWKRFQPAIQRLGALDRDPRGLARRNGGPQRQRQVVDEDV